ncbi:MAG: glycosyltransferase family 2 protein [Pirellulales bacterium]|nr:glycosyltransferase family 2 protein [Pirellulales bacterium]
MMGSVVQRHDAPALVQATVEASRASDEGRAALQPRQMTRETKVSVVIPCFNEQEVLPLLFERLQAVLPTWGTDFEVILIDDGSRDATWALLLEVHRRDPRWKLLRLARNFGHQTALRAGLQASRGDLVVVLDADLQDPPEVLPRFFDQWKAGHDVVYAVRQHRKEGWFMRTAYSSFYRTLSLLSEFDVPLDSGDFCLMDRQVVELIKAMPERQPFIRGLRSWVGFSQVAVSYERDARAAGKSKYNFRRLMALALDGILSSSTYPLRLATWFGATVSCIAFAAAVLTLFIRIFAVQVEPWGLRPAPGIASTIICVLFLGGVQLLCLGILGEYLGRIYENVKSRPMWTIRETRGLHMTVSDAQPHPGTHAPLGPV